MMGPVCLAGSLERGKAVLVLWPCTVSHTCGQRGGCGVLSPAP